MIAARRFLALYLSEQFGRFLLVGGIAVVPHWLSRIALNQIMSYAWAITLAYLVGILVAFVLNKIYVFPYSKRSVETELSLFFVVNVAAFPAVWVTAFILGEWVLPAVLSREPAHALGHGIAILLPVFFNFAMHKFITFRSG